MCLGPWWWLEDYLKHNHSAEPVFFQPSLKMACGEVKLLSNYVLILVINFDNLWTAVSITVGHCKIRIVVEGWNRRWALKSQIKVQGWNRSWALKNQIAVESWTLQSQLKSFLGNFEKGMWNLLYSLATVKVCLDVLPAASTSQVLSR